MIAEVVLYISAAANIASAIVYYLRARKLRLQPKPEPVHTHSFVVIAVSHFEHPSYAGTFTSVLRRCQCGDFQSVPIGGTFTLEDFTVTPGLVDDVLKRMEKTA